MKARSRPEIIERRMGFRRRKEIIIRNTRMIEVIIFPKYSSSILTICKECS